MNSKHFSISDLNTIMGEVGGPVLAAYTLEYPHLRAEHPTFHRGWGVPVTHPHRFMNYVVASAFANECDGPWLDISAYDGALVMLLRRMGVEAYGLEPVEWSAMWRMLGIADVMNVTIARPHVVSALNCAHAFEPREYVRKIIDTYGDPKLLLIDREERTPHPNNALWFDDTVIDELGFTEIVSFPDLAKDNLDYGRQLLVRRR
jgi:hypothetical protein